ncbi:MAG TPA: hypothetical protein VLA60_00730 [Nitrospirales bacterium]|nr:hypothetical protein [Nitrospirales bacterium]
MPLALCLNEFCRIKGRMELPLLLDHAGYLPPFGHDHGWQRARCNSARQPVIIPDTIIINDME